MKTHLPVHLPVVWSADVSVCTSTERTESRRYSPHSHYYHPFDKSKTNENTTLSTYPGGTVTLPTRLWLLPYSQRTDLDLTLTHCYLMYAVAAWMMEIKNKGAKQEQRIVRKLNLKPMAYDRNTIQLNANKRTQRDTT